MYGLGPDSHVRVVAQPDKPLPYGHEGLPTFLASQLVRRLGSFRPVDLDELVQELEERAA